jgi:hypothetical protein
LLQLCEAESISYLDEVATLPKIMQLGQTLALEVSSFGADDCWKQNLLLFCSIWKFHAVAIKLITMINAGS